MSEPAQKSYLINSTHLTRLLNNTKNQLPDKMKSVAKSDLPAKEKFYEYSKLYTKYFDDIEKQRQPLEIIEKSVPTSVQLEDSVVSSPNRKITQLVPKSYLERARQIYARLLHSPDIKWTNDKVFIHGEQIGDLNIFDYIKLYTSKKKIKDVEGYDEFKQYLDNSFISNDIQQLEGNGWLKYDF
jgi:hypothetical protein